MRSFQWPVSRLRSLNPGQNAASSSYKSSRSSWPLGQVTFPLDVLPHRKQFSGSNALSSRYSSEWCASGSAWHCTSCRQSSQNLPIRMCSCKIHSKKCRIYTKSKYRNCLYIFIPKASLSFFSHPTFQRCFQHSYPCHPLSIPKLHSVVQAGRDLLNGHRMVMGWWVISWFWNNPAWLDWFWRIDWLVLMSGMLAWFVDWLIELTSCPSPTMPVKEQSDLYSIGKRPTWRKTFTLYS